MNKVELRGKCDCSVKLQDKACFFLEILHGGHISHVEIWSATIRHNRQTMMKMTARMIAISFIHNHERTHINNFYKTTDYTNYTDFLS